MTATISQYLDEPAHDPAKVRVRLDACAETRNLPRGEQVVRLPRDMGNDCAHVSDTPDGHPCVFYRSATGNMGTRVTRYLSAGTLWPGDEMLVKSGALWWRARVLP
jgi:hypothetical protein